LTLFCQSMAFAHWSMLSLLTPLEQTWYHKWFFLEGWLWHWRFKWRKFFIETLTQRMCFFFFAIEIFGVFISKPITFFSLMC
jgi:hypothetical protein